MMRFLITIILVGYVCGAILNGDFDSSNPQTGDSSPWKEEWSVYGINNLSYGKIVCAKSVVNETFEKCLGIYNTEYTPPYADTSPFIAWFHGYGLSYGNGSLSYVFPSKKCTSILKFRYQVWTFGNNLNFLNVTVNNDTVAYFNSNNNNYPDMNWRLFKKKITLKPINKLTFYYETQLNFAGNLTHFFVDSVNIL